MPVTTPEFYVRKIAPIKDRLPSLELILVVDDRPGDHRPTDDGSTMDLRTALTAVGEDFEIPPTDPSDMALLHFISGPTGMPKGAIHVHEAVVAHHATAASALDLREWCVLLYGGSGLGDGHVVRHHQRR